MADAYCLVHFLEVDVGQRMTPADVAEAAKKAGKRVKEADDHAGR